MMICLINPMTVAIQNGLLLIGARAFGVFFRIL